MQPNWDDSVAIRRVNSELYSLAVRGGAAVMTAQGCQIFALAASTMVLARLLTPTDFGLIAMVTSIMGCFTIILQFGLLAATVQRVELTHDQVSTMFWINVSLSVLLLLLFVAIAPAVARFYEEPRLTSIMLALACVFLFTGLGLQHKALLMRRMRFASLAAIDLISILAGLATAVLLAWAEAHYWALVFQSIVAEATAFILFWAFSGWRPGLPVRHSAAREMLRFGGHLVTFRFIEYFSSNLDKVLIGHVWGGQQLGLYVKAYTLNDQPIQQLNAISPVAMTTLCRLQDDPERYRAYFRRGMMYLLSLSAPVLVFLFVDAEPFILTVLGQQWLSAIPLFKVLIFGTLAKVVVSNASWVYLSLGRTDRQLRWGALEAAVLILSFVIGVQWGAFGIAAAYSVTACAMRIPGLLYCFKGSALKLKDFASSAWRPVLAALLAGSTLVAVQRIYPLGGPVILRLALDLAMYALFYALVWLLMPNGWQIARETLTLARELKGASRGASDLGAAYVSGPQIR